MLKSLLRSSRTGCSKRRVEHHESSRPVRNPPSAAHCRRWTWRATSCGATSRAIWAARAACALCTWASTSSLVSRPDKGMARSGFRLDLARGQLIQQGLHHWGTALWAAKCCADWAFTCVIRSAHRYRAEQHRAARSPRGAGPAEQCADHASGRMDQRRHLAHCTRAARVPANCRQPICGESTRMPATLQPALQPLHGAVQLQLPQRACA